MSWSKSLRPLFDSSLKSNLRKCAASKSQFLSCLCCSKYQPTYLAPTLYVRCAMSAWLWQFYCVGAEISVDVADVEADVVGGSIKLVISLPDQCGKLPAQDCEIWKQKMNWYSQRIVMDFFTFAIWSVLECKRKTRRENLFLHLCMLAAFWMWCR